MRSHARRGAILSRGLQVLVLIAASLVTVVSVQAASTLPAAAETAQSEPLLLIHGFNDDCGSAFNSTGSNSGEQSTLSYLHSAGFSTIDEVGYYTRNNNNYTDTADPSTCTSDLPGGSGNRNLNDTSRDGDSASDATSQCNGTLSSSYGTLSGPSSAFGTKDDHIDRLACLMSWYIFDNYTRYGRAVNVLAHSMGGLIIREAIGRTSAGAAHFPPAKLWVLRVVTVATPHGGIGGSYRDYAAGNNYTNGAELDDMQPGQPFMNTINSFGKPQGQGGTSWTLMGASDGPYWGSGAEPALVVGCPAGESTWPYDGPNKISCGGGDGDGVVPIDSQMAMSADYKITYGIQSYYDTTCSCVQFSVADPRTQYEHEPVVPTCSTYNLFLWVNINVCFHGPFYLTDANSAQDTAAWVCSTGCTGTTIPSSLNQSVYHSLKTIFNRLTASATPPVPSAAPLTFRSAPSGNGLFVSAEMGYTGTSYGMLRARASAPGPWESWTQVSLPGGFVALRNNYNGKYATEVDSQAGMLAANSSTIARNQLFRLTTYSDGTFSVLSVANGLYVSTELGYTGSTYAELRARASTVGAWEHYTTNPGQNFSGPTVTVVESNTTNCPGTSQYFNATDANGVPISWTYANGSYHCITVNYQPYETTLNCQYYFYVPKGDATAIVVFTVQYLDLNGIPRKFTASLDEAPVDGWQFAFSGSDVINVWFQDNNGQPYSDRKQIGWGRNADHGLRQNC